MDPSRNKGAICSPSDRRRAIELKRQSPFPVEVPGIIPMGTELFSLPGEKETLFTMGTFDLNNALIETCKKHSPH